MAAAAIVKITPFAISRPLLHIFEPKLIQRLQTGPTARFTVKIYIGQKSKMSAAAILESVKWQ